MARRKRIGRKKIMGMSVLGLAVVGTAGYFIYKNWKSNQTPAPITYY